MPERLQLGFDNYALRSMDWKAPRLVDYAIQQRLDVLLLSTPDVFESHDAAALSDLRRRAADGGVALQAGMLSICPSSQLFDARRGAAQEQLKAVIRIAQAVGSPVARCVLGIVHDRNHSGGIGPLIEETVTVLREVRTFAVDHGVRIAVENHAGDLQARELVQLIQAAGEDFVGALVDAGNATWALEDPLENLRQLCPYAITTGLRDSRLWATDTGATLEWTAMGAGNVDWREYFRVFRELCPRVPVILETIPARRFKLPFLRREFWAPYPEARAGEFAAFLAMAARGCAPTSLIAQAEMDRQADDPAVQLACLEESLRYCRDELGLGSH